MLLTRCKDQKPEELEEFYDELMRREGYVGRTGAKAMLDLIARLKSMPDDRRVFGLTSHYRLVLLAEDSYKSPWFVILGAIQSKNFHIEYLVPKSSAPWPGAYIRGECRSEDDVIRMIETAMERSGGWSSLPAVDD
jgi:hypothetical protein